MHPGFSNNPVNVFAYHAPLFGLKNSLLRKFTPAASARRTGLPVFLCHSSRCLTGIPEILKRKHVDKRFGRVDHFHFDKVRWPRNGRPATSDACRNVEWRHEWFYSSWSLIRIILFVQPLSLTYPDQRSGHANCYRVDRESRLDSHCRSSQ